MWFLRAFLVLECFPHKWQETPGNSMCVDSTWRDMSFLPGIIFPQVRHSHILCPILFSIFRIKVLIWESSSSTVLWHPAKTLALDHILLKLAIKEQSFRHPYAQWQCGFWARSLSWRVFHRGGNRRQGTRCVLTQCASTCHSCGCLSCHRRHTPILFDQTRWSPSAWDHWSVRQVLQGFCRSLQILCL